MLIYTLFSILINNLKYNWLWRGRSTSFICYKWQHVQFVYLFQTAGEEKSVPWPCLRMYIFNALSFFPNLKHGRMYNWTPLLIFWWNWYIHCTVQATNYELPVSLGKSCITSMDGVIWCIHLTFLNPAKSYNCMRMTQ